MERVLVVLGLLPIVIAGSLDDCPPVVRENTHFKYRFRDTCYLFVSDEVFWADARDACWNLGGEMIMIKDQETMQHISGILDSSALGWRNSGVWLGAEYLKRRWVWTTGEEVSYQNWASGQGGSLLPGLSLENCAAIRRQDNWKWHDYPCRLLKFHYHYICQFRVVPKRHQTTRATPLQYIELPSPMDSGVIHARGKVPVDMGPFRGSMGPREGAAHLLLDTLRSHGGIPGQQISSSQLGQHAHNTHDNGNTVILTAVLCVGGVLALMLLIFFFIFQRHQKRKYANEEPIVHFENVSYNQRDANSSNNLDAQAREEEAMYLTPVQARVVYDQASKTVSHNLSRASPSSGSSSESLGACGGAPLHSSITKLAGAVVELPSPSSLSSDPHPSTSASSQPLIPGSPSSQPLLSRSSNNSNSSIASQPLPPTPPEAASLLAAGSGEGVKMDGSYMEMNTKRKSNLYVEPNRVATSVAGKPDPNSETAPLYCNTMTSSTTENHYEPLP